MPRSRTSNELTRRQVEALSLVARGLSNQQAADRLGLKVGVVGLYLHHACQRLGVKGKDAAIAKYGQDRLMAVVPDEKSARLRRWHPALD